MAPGNKERHPGHTGTIPKTKVRNNCNVPQEAVTPTRRDMATNLVSTSLDWVPVSEYNTRSNCNQSRKQTNNSSEQELNELDNAITFESGFGRFVPVRPQPRALPLTVQNRENVPLDHHDESDVSLNTHSLHPYAHQMQNGLMPHSNHATAAVMIVNPTTPNATGGNMPQPFNAANQNRNNLARNLNSTRNTFEVNTCNNNNTTPPISNQRSGTKSVNLMNNMFDQGQGSFNNINENSHVHRESARALGEAIVAACPDAAAVERRLGQIREYIRVTSSLVDTMRSSEDEDVVVRPVSVQSNNGSAYSDNELWQNEIKNKMEMSQIRLTALKQQQKRLLKYQAEAKQQLEELNKDDRSQDNHHPSTSQDNFSGMQQNIAHGSNYHHSNRMYAANQIGVATTLPQSVEALSSQQPANNIDHEHARSMHSTHSQDDRFYRDGTIVNCEGGAELRDSSAEEEELHERGRALQLKLRELHFKKQHMEQLVTEFQKLQMATRLETAHNTYSSSGEDSADEEPLRNKTGPNLNNEDPFKLMEINAIKTALQKTKDLMRSVETFETDQLSGVHEEAFQIPTHSNIHDNRSESGAGSAAGGSAGAVASARRAAGPRTPRHLHSHEANINSLQELAQELRMETEKIMSERARIKDMITNKEQSRKQKKVNEEVGSASGSGTVCGGGSSGGGGGGAPSAAERRLMQLRALLADKQRELDSLLTHQVMNGTEPPTVKTDSRTASVANQSYNSDQEEHSRSEHIPLDSQSPRDAENFRTGADSARPAPSHPAHSRSAHSRSAHSGSAYCSDSDSASRNKSNQRNRSRRRTTQERQLEEISVPVQNNSNPNIRHEPRPDSNVNVNINTPLAQTSDNSGNLQYGHLSPPSWNTNKSNQDMRTNQFTQNSHSQTMERLLTTPHMPFPPAIPYNMMMPYGMMGCGCGCGVWGAWLGQQLGLQQRELHQLRAQLQHLEDRWRVENASHTLNNQVPPGNRANNYWDNFRSYSRQNLLSANSKTNADGHLGVGQSHNPHPLVERSHNTLHHTSSSTSPSVTPKRNTNTVGSSQCVTQSAQTNNDETVNRNAPRNLTYERSLSFSSAPDVLNVNQNMDADTTTQHSRNDENIPISVSNININRQEQAANAFRNLNYTNPIPEIIQSHSNNLNTPASAKKKSSSKLPSKNSANRRNCSLDFSQTSNINIASTSDTPNPNLASTSRETHDKATSKLFDLLRENIYSEVTTLIGVNESHPDFLIQLFRELQLISSEQLRQKVLQSIRGILSQYNTLLESHTNDAIEENGAEAIVTTVADTTNCNDCSASVACSSAAQIDNKVVRFLLLKSDEVFTTELLESLTSLILNDPVIKDKLIKDKSDNRQIKKLYEILSKYEGMRVCDISSNIIENLAILVSGNNDGDESSHLTSELSESSILQDVAGSLNLFSSSDTQLHEMNSCRYDMWSGHVHMNIDGGDLNDNSQRSSQEGKVDLINCSEMHNGDLAEADQTCHTDAPESGANGDEDLGANVEALPDVVDTDEVTPTEAEAEWIGLDRVPTRLHMEESSEKQKDKR